MKPCPFCGSNDIDPVIIDQKDMEGTPVALSCSDCGAQGPWSYVQDNLVECKEYICAITKWDNRSYHG
jgi:formate dehydrogenase maturation protein FdhE